MEEVKAMEGERLLCPNYHNLSHLRQTNTYYPNLSQEHIKAVQYVLQTIKEENLSFITVEENENLKVLRFLRARQFDIDATLTMIRNDDEWRNDETRSQLRYQTAYEILQCDLSIIYRYFPTWTQGYDKQCRPISWRQYGKFDMTKVLKQTTMERLINFHLWEIEQMLRLSYTKSKVTGLNVENFLFVVDVSGWHLGLANQHAYTFIKALIQMDSDHYPERLGQLIVINAPNMFSMAWRVIEGFMNDVQKRKIQIHGINQEEWLPHLLSLIDADQIPVQYGGTMPDFPLELALSTMDPPPRSFFHSTNGDDETIVPKDILCGSSKKRSKKKSKKKTENGVEAGVDFENPPSSLMCASPSSSSGPLCGIGGGSGNSNVDMIGNNELKETKKSGWMSVLNCSTPTCNGGEEEFDFQMEAPVDHNNNIHKQTSVSTDIHDDQTINHNNALPKPPSVLKKSSSNQRNKQQQQQQQPPQSSVEFAYSDVYQNPDGITPTSASHHVYPAQTQMRKNEATSAGNVHPNQVPPSATAPKSVPMFTNNPPSKSSAAPVVNTKRSGCACVIM